MRTEEEIYTDLVNLNYYVLRMSINRETARQRLEAYKNEIKVPSEKLDTKIKEVEDNINFWLEQVGNIISKTRADLKETRCDCVTVKIRNGALHLHNMITDKNAVIEIKKDILKELEEIITFEILNILE